MKFKTLAACFAVAAALIARPAFADAPNFDATCPKGVAVHSNGKGKIRINGQKAKVKAVSATAWQAHAGGITIDIGRDGAQVFVSSAGEGGDVCEVTSSSAPPNRDGSIGGVSAKDQQACLAAVSNETNNGDVQVLEAMSSEANNSVTVGVGSQRARWQCLVKDGKVAGVMSLTDEGKL